MQTRIPCVQMRGGTSKGAYFLASDLPADPGLRDRVLLAVMGSPDSRQIDGIGGADSLTSKVAIVSPATRGDADVDYLFAQVLIDEARVDYGQNCGNMLAGVGPFAIELGLVPAQGETTRVSIHMVNTGQVAIATVSTPDGRVEYGGDQRIDGVPGTAAAIPLEFKDTAGSSCGALLPTGNVRDLIDGVEATLIDNGMPTVVLRAQDLGRTGYESREELDADEELKARIEGIRLAAGPMMKLGDVARRTVPKMCLVSPPRQGGALNTRSFIPHVCHASIGVLGAVSAASAAVLTGSVCDGVAQLPPGDSPVLGIEHPSGELSTQMHLRREGDAVTITSAALIRTARWLFDGHVHIPGRIWNKAGRR
ncbi:4-oxalomesaconate tautomerase [Pusillimonas sp.]|uniref:4-oxalomesaconate tautomerase n=1 Tax=Pusillimonas sp. TaxID=3040095 RepID=UPI0029ABEFBA|nr:4-oxalomesaconate tautomerase [Pusillimonas sp.]MDX3896175.1 4-oxalomesaconate tautomerase [Pusillimonas sp.]